MKDIALVSIKLCGSRSAKLYVSNSRRYNRDMCAVPIGGSWRTMSRYSPFDWWMPEFLGLRVIDNEIIRVFCCIRTSTRLHPRFPVTAGGENVVAHWPNVYRIPLLLSQLLHAHSGAKERRNASGVKKSRPKNLFIEVDYLQGFKMQMNASSSGSFSWMS
jgi:hypothetical protein